MFDRAALGIAGHEYDLLAGPKPQRRCGNVCAIQAWHCEIEQEQIEHLSLQQIQRLRATLGLPDAVAARRQAFCQEAADVGIVIDNKNGAQALRNRERGLFSCSSFLPGYGSLHPPEEQGDGGSFARRAFDPGDAARLMSDPINHAEAQTGALAGPFGGEEGIEGALGDLRRHSDSRVRNAELDILAGGKVRVCIDEAQTRANADPSAVGHCVPRVDREVQDGKLKLRRIGEHRNRGVLIKIEVDLNGRP